MTLSPCRAFGLSERILRARSTLTRACSQPTHTCRDRGKRQKRRVPLAARSDCRNALFARVQFSRAPALSRRTHAARRNRHSTPKAALPISQKPICPRLLSSHLVQPTRRAAAFAGLAKGRGKLSAHAAHRVDHLVRGHDQPHARNCGGSRRTALKDVTFTPRDYLLPVSFSRHAAQPPSPVSRRDAGSCLPTRRIASITSSAGMIGPTPEIAGFAAHGAE